MALDNLKRRWLSLFPDAAHDLALAGMDELVAKYGEPHRRYHTLTHVGACLALFDSVRDKLDDPLSVELALWFHDVIYDPTRNDNEDCSADYAEGALSRLGASRNSVNKVRELIAVTKHPSAPKNDDEAYMVDIDLAILASPDDVYRRYAGQIRAEYSHVPEAHYREGRTGVLKRLLAQDNLYFTDYFRRRCEAPARENMRREIEMLAGR